MATITCAAATTVSVPVAGMPPWPPVPRIVTSNVAVCDMTAPVLIATLPVIHAHMSDQRQAKRQRDISPHILRVVGKSGGTHSHTRPMYHVAGLAGYADHTPH